MGPKAKPVWITAEHMILILDGMTSATRVFPTPHCAPNPKPTRIRSASIVSKLFTKAKATVKTEYQARHITGDGMGKKYSCPECSTMRTNGICVDQDAMCRSGSIRHPLNYYRYKTIDMKRGKTEAKPAEKVKEEKTE